MTCRWGAGGRGRQRGAKEGSSNSNGTKGGDGRKTQQRTPFLFSSLSSCVLSRVGEQVLRNIYRMFVAKSLVKQRGVSLLQEHPLRRPVARTAIPCRVAAQEKAACNFLLLVSPGKQAQKGDNLENEAASHDLPLVSCYSFSLFRVCASLCWIKERERRNNQQNVNNLTTYML